MGRPRLFIKPEIHQTANKKLPKFYSKKDILEASIVEGTNYNYTGACFRFKNWLNSSNRLDKNIPTWLGLIKSGSIKEFDDEIISDYITCKEYVAYEH